MRSKLKYPIHTRPAWGKAISFCGDEDSSKLSLSVCNHCPDCIHFSVHVVRTKSVFDVAASEYPIGLREDCRTYCCWAIEMCVSSYTPRNLCQGIPILLRESRSCFSEYTHRLHFNALQPMKLRQRQSRQEPRLQ